MDHSQKSPMNAVLGKQYPHSIENEQALLGALILDSERIGDVSSIVDSDDFYVDKHTAIYNSLISLSNRSTGIDVVTLLSDLVKNGVYTEESGSQYIRLLAESVPTLSNILDYAAIVHEKALLRKLLGKVLFIICNKCTFDFLIFKVDRSIFIFLQGTLAPFLYF
jgi:replicative DNA helicase